MSDGTQIWACGGGTQSAAIAVLIIQGRLPKPDLAVIVDTERERSSTWRYVDSVVIPALSGIGITLHRVPKSRYATVDLWGGKDGNSLLIPAFTNQSGEIGKLPGFCSNEWKTRVMQRWAAREHGVTSAVSWIGLSTDERRRLPTVAADGPWQKRFPLMELGMNRGDCYATVARFGWPPPPHSSCWMCPNHREDEWREIHDNDPADMAAAATLESEFQKIDPSAWLHSECKPIATVDFDDRQNVLFGGCDSGMCFT